MSKAVAGYKYPNVVNIVAATQIVTGTTAATNGPQQIETHAVSNNHDTASKSTIPGTHRITAPTQPRRPPERSVRPPNPVGSVRLVHTREAGTVHPQVW